jgi:hypothetical protein
MPDGSRRTVGYTEGSRGCKHLCRHCPIVPVYDGEFRIVQREIVLADIRQQVAAGAEHISFGDPDFFNGPGHSLKIVEAMHAEFPDLTYDVVIKIEHLLRHADLLPRLRDTNCLFVTAAVESFEDAVLEALAKRHTRADVAGAVSLCRAAGLQLSPTFVAFTPWTTLPSYALFLQELARLGFVESIPPIQYGIRLLVPASSRLLELPDIAALVQPFEAESLCHLWSHIDPRVDAFHADVLALVEASEKAGASRRGVFDAVMAAAARVYGRAGPYAARAARDLIGLRRDERAVVLLRRAGPGAARGPFLTGATPSTLLAARPSSAMVRLDNPGGAACRPN